MRACSTPRRISLAWLALLLGCLSLPGRAQHACLLVPLPLEQRLDLATWVVEAEAAAPIVQQAGGHLFSRHALTIYKVFRGPSGAALPAAVLLAGGTLGNLREVVSSTPQLREGQQGVFFLEPDPQNPGAWRLLAGPQGLIAYDLPSRSAAEPFASYPDISTELYPALRDPAQARGYREVRANTALSAAQPPQRRPDAVPVISGLSPNPTMAGTGVVLTITGSNFGATRGTGSVQFLNADNGGTSRVRPLDTDYVSWSDTQIQVRVPSYTQEGSPAGSGTVVVVNSNGETGTSTTTLNIEYAISNVAFNPPTVTFRPKLVNDNGSGGYTLQYAPSFQSNTLAQAAFERAITTWACSTGANRVIGANTSVTTASQDNVNVVGFDVNGSLPMNVLGVTYSYYSGCTPSGGTTAVTVPETDYLYAVRSDWNYGPQAPAFSQYDFESVALHELGHGIQLGHVIDPTAVMHYSIANGQNKRTLGNNDDIAGGSDEVQFSLIPFVSPCASLPMVPLVVAGCSPLPVELVEFTAEYQPGRGTVLRWVTASEHNNDYFVVEARDDVNEPWQDVQRVPAAGFNSARKQYEALDPRPLLTRRYYRLRQVDQDGTTAFSRVVTVEAPVAAGGSLELFPNPAVDGTLYVLRPAGPVSAGQLRVFDSAGRLVRQQATNADATVGALPVADLRPGLYLLEWTAGSSRWRSRFTRP